MTREIHTTIAYLLEQKGKILTGVLPDDKFLQIEGKKQLLIEAVKSVPSWKPLGSKNLQPGDKATWYDMGDNILVVHIEGTVEGVLLGKEKVFQEFLSLS